MFQALRVAIVASAISITAWIGAVSAFAQDRDNTGGATTTTRTVREDDDGFDMSWIGLLGLAGLAGLIPRNRNDRHIVGTTTTTPANRH